MRIVIAIPVHAQMQPDFGVCLAALAMFTTRQAPSIQLAIQRRSSSILAAARTELWRWAEDKQADYLLFADADQTFPQDGLLRLLDRQLDAVGTNYRARLAEAVLSTGRGLDGEPLPPPRPGMGVEKVKHLGLGFCLLHVKAISAALAEQARRDGRDSHYPLFAQLPDPDGRRNPDGTDMFTGEDVYFFDKLRAAGIDVHVDHDLSVDIGHIADIHLTFPN